jgi:molybdate transport system substrate-binding protein
MVICPAARADVTVAVAANFEPVLQRLVPVFEAGSGQHLRIIPGSTGSLYAQIRQGAPFDVFLAADERRPRRLEEEGLIVAGSRFTYAVGRLVLWGPATWVRGGMVGLGDPVIKRIAIANPDTAPYGHAAFEALTAAGLWRAVQPKLIRGQAISQAFQYVATGNADVGLVALSQVISYHAAAGFSYQLVPPDDYKPLTQQAVLLRSAGTNPGAVAFMTFLRAARTRDTIRDYGYGL